MTRQEAELDIRKIQRRCRGHWLLNEADRNVLRTRFAAIYEAKKWDNAVRFKAALESTLKLGTEEIAENDWNHLFTRVAGIIFGCKENCGYDVNNMICANPLDGVEREVSCPNCGAIATFSSRYDITE